MVEKDFTGDERTIHFAQTSAPTIVNSFALEDASKKAYGRVSGGFSAAILSTVSLDVAGSATIGKDQGDETSAQRRVPLRLLGMCGRREASAARMSGGGGGGGGGGGREGGVIGLAMAFGVDAGRGPPSIASSASPNLRLRENQ